MASIAARLSPISCVSWIKLHRRSIESSNNSSEESDVKAKLKKGEERTRVGVSSPA